jgi:hypothetical protein
MQNPNQRPQLPSMNAEQIKGTSDSYKGMILQQIGRITYLLTLGNARYDGPTEMFSEKSMAKSALRGMQVLEAMIKPILDKTYEEKTRPLKPKLLQHLKQFSSNDNDILYFDVLTQWLEVIIEHLDKLNMIPEEEIEIEFD